MLAGYTFFHLYTLFLLELPIYWLSMARLWQQPDSLVTLSSGSGPCWLALKFPEKKKTMKINRNYFRDFLLLFLCKNVVQIEQSFVVSQIP